jgi:hypothetical protein
MSQTTENLVRIPVDNVEMRGILDRGLGTLLFDVLTGQEGRIRESRSDIPLLTDCLAAVTERLWTREMIVIAPDAASALRAATRPEDGIGAIVSRGERVDVAADWFAGAIPLENDSHSQNIHGRDFLSDDRSSNSAPQ